MIGSVLWFSLGILCMFFIASIIKKIIKAIKITKKEFYIGVIDMQKYVFSLLREKIKYFFKVLFCSFQFEDNSDLDEESPNDKNKHLIIVKREVENGR